MVAFSTFFCNLEAEYEKMKKNTIERLQRLKKLVISGRIKIV